MTFAEKLLLWFLLLPKCRQDWFYSAVVGAVKETVRQPATHVAITHFVSVKFIAHVAGAMESGCNVSGRVTVYGVPAKSESETLLALRRLGVSTSIQ